MDAAIAQAVEFLANSAQSPPASESVVKALLAAEKAAKRDKNRYSYNQLLGTWRLGFITVTKRVRQRAGVVLGAGQFPTKWVDIQLSFSSDSSSSETNSDRGRARNSVALGPLRLILTGPTRYWPQMNILAFDFTRMQLVVGGVKLYNGFIRNGKTREARFYDLPVKQQAFFVYFLVQNDYIAARGKGGGLALWVRLSD
jgi:hypothetical protein